MVEDGKRTVVVFRQGRGHGGATTNVGGAADEATEAASEMTGWGSRWRPLGAQ